VLLDAETKKREGAPPGTGGTPSPSRAAARSAFTKHGPGLR
jgi:hypothetical protein